MLKIFQKKIKRGSIILFLIIASNTVYSANVDFDFGVGIYNSAPIKPAVGPIFGVALNTPMFNLGIKSKLLLPDISSTNREFDPLIQSSLNLEIKHRLKTFPVILIGGVGLGYGSKFGFSENPEQSRYKKIDETLPLVLPVENPLKDENQTLSGIYLELSFGVLYPITQYLTGLFRMYGAYNVQSTHYENEDNNNNWKLDYYSNTDLSGFGIEFSIRYSLFPSYKLKY